jgi:predicted permease
MRVRLKQDSLADLIARSGLSQNHWALRLGLSRGHWSDIVNGKHPYPSARTRQLMLDALEVPFDALFAVDAVSSPADATFQAAIAERYVIDRELGQGGMGTVFLARDLRLNRTVAIKVISPEAVGGIGIDRFLQETGWVARLQHPHIVPLYDAGAAAGQPYYVMPAVSGGSLHNRLSDRHRLPLDETMAILRGVGAALAHAHAHQVLHCDIKPGNILLEGTHAWVADFGIARVLHGEAAGWRQRGAMETSAGTPAYVSPEQASGEMDLDGRSDLFSLACATFEMLAGRPPFEGPTTRDVVAQRFAGTPPDLSRFAPDVPRGVAAAITQALALNRDDRHRSVTAFVEALEHAVEDRKPAIVSQTRLGFSRLTGRARRRVGSWSSARALSRIVGGFSRAISLTEIRNAHRSLWRSPTTTVCGILCLGLGIGATAALSSAISRALLRPLPFLEPGRLVAIHRITPQSGPNGGWSQSAPNYLDLATRSTQIQGLAAITWSSAIVELPTVAVQASGLRVTGNLFHTLGARAQFGRLIEPTDDRPDAPFVAVVSHEFWRSVLGGDRAIVGRTVSINGQPMTLVGVLQPEFHVPLGRSFLRADLWVPMRFTPGQRAERRSNYLLTLGRLARGATVHGAETELRGIFANLVSEYPELRGDNVRVAPLEAESLQPVRTPLLLLFGAVGMVLLIAAANVAALLLARGVQRRRELAVRAALGGTSWDALRLVLSESLVLCAWGVAVGVALAFAGVRTIGLLAAERLPQLDGLQLDLRVLAFGLALGVLVAFVCGAVPAWRGAHVDPQEVLRGGRVGGSGRESARTLGALVVAEIALSLMLLIGAGLVLKGFARLLASDPGFDPSRIFTLSVNTSPTRYPNGSALSQFVEPAIAAIKQVVGVEAAAVISAVPYQTWGNNSGIRYEGRPADDPANWPIVEQRQVTLQFFDVTRQRLISGRLLLSGDNERAPYAVVVNQALVRRDFAGRDPIGKRFFVSDSAYGTIVGVVTDIKDAGPVSAPEPEMYSTLAQTGGVRGSISLMVRTRSTHASDVEVGVRTAIKSVDPTAAIALAVPMTEVISRSLGAPRFYFSLLGTFAGIAILLAAAGLYGILSYAVARRTHEIGIRSALGSSRAAIIRLIAGLGLRLVVAGVALGLAGAAVVTRLMVFMLYGVSPLDASTWAQATLLLVAVAMAAAVIPATRASNADPLIAIRAD